MQENSIALPAYVASDELLQDLRDLGYKSIEIEDLIELLEDDEIYEHITQYIKTLNLPITFDPATWGSDMYHNNWTTFTYEVK